MRFSGETLRDYVHRKRAISPRRIKDSRLAYRQAIVYPLRYGSDFLFAQHLIVLVLAYLASGNNSLIFISSFSLSIVICLTPTFLEYLMWDGSFVGCAKIILSPCTPYCITCAISCYWERHYLSLIYGLSDYMSIHTDIHTDIHGCAEN